MDPVMYLFLNRGAGMSTGKAAAQAAHAAVEAYRDAQVEEFSSTDARLRNLWLKGLHYKKLTMLAEDETHLFAIDRYLRDRGLRTYLIIDEGLTEIRSHTACALGVPVVDKDDPETAAIFSTFKLYKDQKPEPPVEARIGGKLFRFRGRK
jgi:peptidyl-tRNA hydrolase